MQKLVMLIVMAIAMIATGSKSMVNADSGKEVGVKGLEAFEPNALFLSDLRFTPENIKVHKGETVVWADNALTSVPHTITIVDPANLPANFAQA